MEPVFIGILTSLTQRFERDRPPDRRPHLTSVFDVQPSSCRYSVDRYRHSSTPAANRRTAKCHLRSVIGGCANQIFTHCRITLERLA